MDLIIGIILGIWSIVVYRICLWLLGFEIKKKNKYKFKCPGCTFEASTNDIALLASITMGHKTHQEV